MRLLTMAHTSFLADSECEEWVVELEEGRKKMTSEKRVPIFPTSNVYI